MATVGLELYRMTLGVSMSSHWETLSSVCPHVTPSKTCTDKWRVWASESWCSMVCLKKIRHLHGFSIRDTWFQDSNLGAGDPACAYAGFHKLLWKKCSQRFLICFKRNSDMLMCKFLILFCKGCGKKDVCHAVHCILFFVQLLFLLLLGHSATLFKWLLPSVVPKSALWNLASYLFKDN